MATYNRGLPMTGAQEDFLRHLLRDLRALWEARHPEKGEGDLAAWMGGLMKKMRLFALKDEYVTSWEQVEELALSRDRARARRLIKALVEVRDRWSGQGGREAVRTPRNLMTAIWTAAGDALLGKEEVRGLVREVTGGDTESTKNLRREEALEVLRRMGAPGPAVYRVTEYGSTRRLR